MNFLELSDLTSGTRLRQTIIHEVDRVPKVACSAWYTTLLGIPCLLRSIVSQTFLIDIMSSNVDCHALTPDTWCSKGCTWTKPVGGSPFPKQKQRNDHRRHETIQQHQDVNQNSQHPRE